MDPLHEIVIIVVVSINIVRPSVGAVLNPSLPSSVFYTLFVNLLSRLQNVIKSYKLILNKVLLSEKTQIRHTRGVIMTIQYYSLIFHHTNILALGGSVFARISFEPFCRSFYAYQQIIREQRLRQAQLSDNKLDDKK